VPRSLLRRGEGPTWLALGACYALWLAATAGLAAAPGPVALVCAALAALATGFHASLQHEALHGHPTRSARLNEALVFPALGLLYPYRRFRDLHLRHHDNEILTDPYDDPESWYLAQAEAGRLSPPLRLALEANRTLLGRMLIGPWLGTVGLLPWALHAAAVAPVMAWTWGVWGLNPLIYVAAVALPGAALIYVRTYIEHRAAEVPGHRSAVVEASLFWRLLFLNNNYHALHHALPGAAWHRLPALWRARREEVLAGNGGYRVPGYGAVFRRFLLRAREPLAHPFLRRGAP
jgi:fatty acid desaturase